MLSSLFRRSASSARSLLRSASASTSSRLAVAAVAAGSGLAAWSSWRESSAGDSENGVVLQSASSSSLLLSSSSSSSSMVAQAAADAHGGRRMVPLKFKDMKVFSGRANPELSKEIASSLGIPLGKISIKAFADGEIGIQVHENVRGKDVYLIQPTSPPGVNDHLMELILMISTMRRASARTITAVIPYYGYARQDRKMQSRVPISAADVARLLESVGVDRVVAVDLHCGQIQGFFRPSTPCDNLEGAVVALPYFAGLALDKGMNVTVVSPDAGGVHRAKHFRDGLKRYGVDASLAMIIKQRHRANQIASMDLVGNVNDSDVIIVDDMIDTAGTLTKAAAELKKRGARSVYAFATHGVFSPPANERIDGSVLDQVVVCNTVPLRPQMKTDKVTQLSIADLLATAIERIHTNESVSSLFR
eukprot:TRINITY_DN36663_c0_g1_i1.p1 TRINITY_DN36663_c0_g1~~TRINITY_DN36663_c0_g1_i1.p1  ORF type:complete len:436 (-),score=217.91 TRINITY_DN36663_c0_g1_i1:79-1335(-)